MIAAMKTAVKNLLAPGVSRFFFRHLISQTGNFNSVEWLGYPVWQNVLDLWTIQETINFVSPFQHMEN